MFLSFGFPGHVRDFSDGDGGRTSLNQQVWETGIEFSRKRAND